MAGVRVGGVLVWAPCAGAVSTSVSIFSYAGEVAVGFLVDAGLVPDPDVLVADFDAELAALSRARSPARTKPDQAQRTGAVR
jgi:hypothetical protein